MYMKYDNISVSSMIIYEYENRNMTMAVVRNEICVILSSSSQQTPLEYKVTRVTHLRQTNMLSILMRWRIYVGGMMVVTN